MTSRRGRPPHPDILTPREWEVLDLLRERLTNEQIAERLGVTIHAARYHVSEILSKLGVATREEAATWQPEDRQAVWRRILVPLTLAQGAALAATGLLLIGLAVLSWGLLRTGNGDTAPNQAQATCEEALDQMVALDGDKAGPIPAIAFRDREVCWRPVPNTARYAFTLTINWYGSCDIWHRGDSLTIDAISTESTTQGDTTSAAIISDNPDYPFPKDLQFSIQAYDANDLLLESGGFASQREIDYPSMCGPRMPASSSSTSSAGQPFDIFANLPPPMPEVAVETGDEPWRLLQGIYRLMPDGSLTSLAAATADVAGSTFGGQNISVSADGRWLAFTSTRAEVYGHEDDTVYLQDLLSGDPAQAIARFPATYSISLSHDGSLLYVAGELVLDEDSIVEPHWYIVDIQNQTISESELPEDAFVIKWSPDGTHVAYTSSGAGEGTLYIAPADFSTRITTDATGYGPIAWAPDSQRLALGSQYGLWLIDLDGTSGKVNDRYVGYMDPMSWTPDGSTVTYAEYAGDPDPHMVTYNVITAAEQTIPGAAPGTWSPDGEASAFVLQGELFVSSSTGSNIRPLIETSQPLAWPPTYAADGSIIFTYGGGHSSISKVRPDGTELTHLGYGGQPAWSPAGDRIAFLRGLGGGLGSVNRISVMGSSGDDIRELATSTTGDVGGCANWGLSWSKDGKSIAYTSWGLGASFETLAQYPDITAVNAPCSLDTSPTPSGVANPALSPDGTLIAYADGQRLTPQIFVAPADHPEQAVAIATGDNPQWSPDGQWLLFER